jgi:hypothetical protein
MNKVYDAALRATEIFVCEPCAAPLRVSAMARAAVAASMTIRLPWPWTAQSLSRSLFLLYGESLRKI